MAYACNRKLFVENKINPRPDCSPFRPRIATAPPQPDRPWHPIGHQHLLLRHSVSGQAGSAGQDPFHGLPGHFSPPQGFGVRAGQRERHLSLPTHSQAFQDHRWVWVCIGAVGLKLLRIWLTLLEVSQCAHKFENLLTICFIRNWVIRNRAEIFGKLRNKNCLWGLKVWN